MDLTASVAASAGAPDTASTTCAATSPSKPATVAVLSTRTDARLSPA
jgi:hypothetical protein